MSDNGEGDRDSDDGNRDSDGDRPDGPGKDRSDRSGEDRSDTAGEGRSDAPGEDRSDGPSEDRLDEPSGDDVPGDVSLSLDATLELLANFDRRTILGYLMDASNHAATVDELVDHLVARKAEQTGERPGHDHVMTTLYHVHVPKLVDAGVIEYDARSKEIRYWRDERLETWHERIRETERE